MTFYFPQSQAKFNQTVHVYRVSSWQGIPTDSDEMTWEWIASDRLPYSQMWDGDKYWIPLILAGKKLRGVFHFNDARKVESKDLREVISLL